MNKAQNKQKNFKLGFTLLELLVVVLIIGILAAIALPQYQSAVRKARVAEAKLSLRALVDATDRYILQHGSFNPFSNSLDELDIEVQTDTNNWEIYLEDCIPNENGGFGCLAVAEPKWEGGYAIEYSSKAYDDENAGKFLCVVCQEGNEGNKTCKSLGGNLIDNDESSCTQYEI